MSSKNAILIIEILFLIIIVLFLFVYLKRGGNNDLAQNNLKDKTITETSLLNKTSSLPDKEFSATSTDVNSTTIETQEIFSATSSVATSTTIQDITKETLFYKADDFEVNINSNIKPADNNLNFSPNIKFFEKFNKIQQFLIDKNKSQVIVMLVSKNQDISSENDFKNLIENAIYDLKTSSLFQDFQVEDKIIKENSALGKFNYKKNNQLYYISIYLYRSSMNNIYSISFNSDFDFKDEFIDKYENKIVSSVKLK